MDGLNWMQRYAAAEVIEQADEGHLTRREVMVRLVAICGTPALAASFLAACASSSTSTSGRDGTSATSAATTSNATSAGAATSSASVGASAASTSTVTTNASAATTASSSARAALSVAADDPAVRHEPVTFPGPAGTLFGEIARPTVAGSRAGVLVIHEIFGLTDHIRDVVRRVARAGYVALAVDLASRAGGTAKAGNVSGALTQGPVTDRVADLDGGLAYLEQQADYSGKLGVVGFCFGGGMTLSYAAAQPKVRAAVPYYGPTPQPASAMSATRAAILAQYGATDTRVNAGIPDLEAALTGKTFEKRIYDGAGHAFNNDTGGGYNEAAATQAWQATIDWFARYLA